MESVRYSRVMPTQLLQGGHPKLVVMVIQYGSGAAPHDVGRDDLSGHLNRLHAADERLEALVGQRRLTAIQLYDPGEGVSGLGQAEMEEWREKEGEKMGKKIREIE